MTVDEKARESVARAIMTARGLSPDTLYQHHDWEDWPTDAEQGSLNSQMQPTTIKLHYAWRRALPWADAAILAYEAAKPVPASGGVEAAPRSRHPQFTQGMRSAEKRAVRWLHDRAVSMNDPHAKSVLDSAAFSYGGECKRALASSTPAEVSVPPTVEEICQRIRDDFHGVTPAEAEAGTAVAWLIRPIGDRVWHLTDDPRPRLGYEMQPLYTTPPATAPDAGMVEAIAAYLKLRDEMVPDPDDRDDDERMESAREIAALEAKGERADG